MLRLLTIFALFLVAGANPVRRNIKRRCCNVWQYPALVLISWWRPPKSENIMYWQLKMLNPWCKRWTIYRSRFTPHGS